MLVTGCAVINSTEGGKGRVVKVFVFVRTGVFVGVLPSLIRTSVLVVCLYQSVSDTISNSIFSSTLTEVLGT